MTDFLTVKNWNTFQHYGRRNPPWIKLHRAVVDDYAFCALSDAAKGHLILLWLFASQNGGMVPVDVPFLEKKLSLTNLDIEVFVSLGFLIRNGGAGKGASK